MEKLAEEFRNGVAAELGGRKPRGPSYSVRLRAVAIAYARQAKARGISDTSIASTLRVHTTTLRSWLDRSSQPAVLPIRVVTERPTSLQLVVHGPASLRIEGLSVESLAELLRLLSC